MLGRKRKEMPTIGSWYKRIQEKAADNTNADYNFHYSYLLKVMKQYIREYDGQMAYFDGQSTFDLLEGAPFINIRYITTRRKICKTTCTTNLTVSGYGKNMLRKIVKIEEKQLKREY